MKEKHVDWESVGRERRKVVSGEGASVNAADHLSELVWSPHTGLTLKSANPRADLRKPLLLWNVGPGDGDGDHHRIIIDQDEEEARRRSAQGKKRKICDEGGSSSFMKWISNITTKQDSLSPLPVACVKSKSNHQNFPSMGFEAVPECASANDNELDWDGFGAMKSKGKETVNMIAGSEAIFARRLRNEEMMFDAIRKLRLSRADILRWMNSEGRIPISHLKGLFVRLRLRMGNEEATCYYVGCITGDEPTQNKCISVDVGGFKSCVATQYVSNHHFLQDEIRAWWIRSGCIIPSLADLNSKFNHRQTFGF